MSEVELLTNAVVPIALALFVGVVFGGAILLAVLALLLKTRQLRRLSTLDHRFSHEGEAYRLVLAGKSGVRLVVDGTPSVVQAIERRSTGGVHSLGIYAFQAGDRSGQVAVRYESWRPRSAEVRVDGTPIFRTTEDYG